MASKVDLHIHTTASDGTDTPAELINKIRATGIETFAVSDHDSIEGAMQIASLDTQGLNFIKAIEFSCESHNGRCHVLGYNYDQNNAEFKKAIDYGKKIRERKLEERLKFLSEEFSVEFTEEEKLELRNTKSVGKPHIARLLIKKGYAQSVGEAIKTYINKCPTIIKRLSAKEAVEAINASGGIAVLAHPLGGEGEKVVEKDVFEQRLEELISYGLKGLECYYSRYDDEKIEFLKQHAKKHSLLISGGSDYHGTNKTIELGTLCASGKKINPEKLTVISEIL